MVYSFRPVRAFRTVFPMLLSGAVSVACSMSIEDGTQSDDRSEETSVRSDADTKAPAEILVSLAFNGQEYQPADGENLSIGFLATESKGNGEKARFFSFEGQKGPYTMAPTAPGMYSVVVHVQRNPPDAPPLTGEVPVNFSAKKSLDITVNLSENSGLVSSSKPADPHPETASAPAEVSSQVDTQTASASASADVASEAVDVSQAVASGIGSADQPVQGAEDKASSQSLSTGASVQVREDSAEDSDAAPGAQSPSAIDVCHPTPMEFFYSPGEQPKTAYNSCTESELVKRGYLSVGLMIEEGAKRAAGGKSCAPVTTIVRHEQTGEAAELAHSCEVEIALRYGFTVVANL